MKEFKLDGNSFNAEAILAECPTVEEFISSPRFAHHWGTYNAQAREKKMRIAYEQAQSLVPKKDEARKPTRVKLDD